MLKEFSVPEMVPAPTSGNLTDHIVENAQDSPNQVVFSRQRGEAWVGVTAAQFLSDVKAIAKGIIASGVEAGQRVGVMSRTRYEWALVDYAIWYAGAISVPIYETSSAEQVEWNLIDSGSVALFAESAKNKAVFEQVAPDLPDVTRLWVFDDDDLDSLMEAGVGVSDEELEARRATVQPDTLATIIYTSGTTGRPKGCMLTHKNLMFEVDNVIAALDEVFRAPGSSTLLFLPVAHVFGRLIQLGAVRARARLGHAPDVKLLLPLLQSFQPTFVLAVPRVFEKIYNSAQQKATAEGKGNIFDKAAHTAIEYSEAIDEGGAGFGLKLKHGLFDALVYKKLRAAMGGKVEWAVSGGAPLGARLGHFFRGVGITVLEGYGLTETSAATTVSRPDSIQVGAVGQPFPGASVRVADDGELLLAGEQVFVGYWNNATATSEVLEPDGWFHSGDIGEIDDRGFVRITGRKKELIVTAAGKNVAPAVLEDRLRSHALIGQCMVVGDQRPYVAAIVSLDPEALPMWLKIQGMEESLSPADVMSHAQVLEEVQGAVDEANKAVSQAESIRKFVIVSDEWTEEGGHLTPSMKLKRSVILKEYGVQIEELYA